MPKRGLGADCSRMDSLGLVTGDSAQFAVLDDPVARHGLVVSRGFDLLHDVWLLPLRMSRGHGESAAWLMRLLWPSMLGEIS